MTIDKQKLKELAQAVADLEDIPEREDEHAEAVDALWLNVHCHTILALLAEIERLERKNANQAESIRQYQDHLVGGDSILSLTNERDQLKAENEALRKQLADLSPFRHAPPQDYRASNKCLACGEYHHGLGNLPCPKCTPVAQAFASVNQRVVPVEPLRTPRPLEGATKKAGPLRSDP